MSYRMPAGLGYDVELDTPFGKRTVSFDLEQVSHDVTTQFVADAWPQLEERARLALPLLVGDAIQYARPEVDAQKKSLIKQAGILVSLLAASVIGAAWYVGRPGVRRRLAA